jgi:hypothetical protein
MDEKIKYPFLYAWDRQMGSLAYWIQEQQLAAKTEDAPKDAIYKRDGNTWVRWSEISNYNVKYRVWCEVQRLKMIGSLEETFELPPKPELSDFPLVIKVTISIQRGGEKQFEESSELQEGEGYHQAVNRLIKTYEGQMARSLVNE